MLHAHEHEQYTFYGIFQKKKKLIINNNNRINIKKRIMNNLYIENILFVQNYKKKL